jgi:hypothetical protein
MIKQLKFVAIALAALWPAPFVSAQHHHHDDHHDDHGVGIHFGGEGGGFGIHLGDDHHDDHGYHHGDLGHHHDPHFDWHHSDWHHSDWHFVVPHFDHHYHGSYYFDDGNHYYVPQHVNQPGGYVAARPVQIEFGAYSHIDDLSGRLERLANQLCLDLHYNYKHNPGFPQTYRAAYQILDTAKYIHVKEHQGDRAEVARRLNDVDGMFHHVQTQIPGWSRRQFRQIGQGGVQTKLQQVEATLHHLMHDVGVKGVHGQPDSIVAPEDAEVAPPPPAGVTLPPPGD